MLSEKLSPEDINLKLVNASMFYDEKTNLEGINLEWKSDLSSGNYLIRKLRDTDSWLADAKCYDSNQDKSFGQELLRQWLTNTLVI